MSTTTDEKNSPAVTSETEEKMKMVVLKSSDSEEFQVEQSVAIQSITIKNMLEECDFSVIPLPNVDSKTLIKVIQYLKLHVGSEALSNDEELKKSDKDFIQGIGDSKRPDDLMDLILAANYLSITGLLDLACQHVADTIKDFSVEEARAYFNIENDFTPDEEAAIRNEHPWVYE